jgi:transcriptional regulator with XRE-family HTH domain
VCAFGKRIEQLAKRRGLSRDELAALAELSTSGLHGILIGRNRPRLDTAAKLAEALGVPLTKLVG